MQKRILMMLGMLLVVMMMGIMPVVAQEETEVAPITEITWTCPSGYEGQTLVLYNWLYFISDTAIAEFETRCGVTIRLETYGSNEELIGSIRQGNPGYDIAFPADYGIAIMIREELIQPIDMTRIPNYANIDDLYKGLSFDPTEEYSVPYLWGTFGALYNTDVYGEDITTWEQIWNFSGRIGWTDDQRSILGIMLAELGYNPNSTDEGELYEALDLLLGYGTNSNLVHISDDPTPLFVRGDLDMVLTYSGDAFQRILECECDNFRYVIPNEGSVLDVESMVLLKDAPNPDLAYLFMDFVHDPFVAALNTNETAYGSVNVVALEAGLIDAEINDTIIPSAEILENMWVIEDIGDAEFIFADVWDEFLITISQ
jgi:spermidine/putrescine transport system substrate-binding protein